QRGVAPRPAQVSARFLGLRYFGGTLRPLSLLPRGLGPRLAPPPPPRPRPSIAESFASSSRRADAALSEIRRTTLSRSATTSSKVIDFSFKALIIFLANGRCAQILTLFHANGKKRESAHND